MSNEATTGDEPTPTDTGQIDREPLRRALSERYLTYALSTIMNRALPDVRDGLKPVHRRLLWAMQQLKLDPNAPFKKSARVVGDVIGKYHPHGDQAVYDALVRLAQDFAQRYPLIDGQGNFGNIDGDNAAAMRYTESRLTKVAEQLLVGLDENAVDFRPTYDGSEEEPEVLPAAFPNLLANGATGIAVGMATSIPPHNVGELCDALLHLIRHPTASAAELVRFVPGPDFPTGGVLIETPEVITEAYMTGRGSFRLRAKWEREDQGRGQWVIVVTEIPWQVQKSRLVEKIAEIINSKKLPILADVRDESTEDIRLVLEPRSRSVEPEVLMESLFKLTELEVRVPLNMNVLVDGRTPQVVSLDRALKLFLDHRRVVLQRRSQHRLAQVAHRLEILDGYIIAYLNLDRVIEIIRTEDEPKPVLMAEFRLSETQAEAILNMRLRSLRKLEEMELRHEHEKLMQERDGLTALLADEAAQWRRLAVEISEIRQKFGKDSPGGARRTGFGVGAGMSLPPPETYIEREPITVILSEKGWIRAIKGHQPLDAEVKHRDGDQTLFALHAETTDKLVIFASNGRFYTIGADKLPGGRGMGEPLRLMIDLGTNDDVLSLRVHKPERQLLVASQSGRGFIVAEAEALAQTRAGKQVLVLDENDKALLALPISGDHLAVVGQNRKLLVFPLSELPTMARGKGVTLQKYRDGGLSDARCLTLSEGLSWLEGSGRLRQEKILTEWLGKRAAAGSMAPRGFPRDNKFGEPPRDNKTG